ncbi:30S ribosomal protein S6 [Candidatus Peribacteria bacterium]|nr:MAG: 30S ribosomal protein S6 [Candidatus Peribacteria bacterium]
MATLKEIAKKKAAPVLELDEDNEPRIYEVAVLYPFPMNQKEETTLQKSIEDIFTAAGATQVMKDVWGRRGLAYKIGGYTEGTFIIYYYNMDPSKVKDVDTELRILKGMLRHMIVKPPKNYQIVPYADNYLKWKDQEKLMQEKATMDKEERLKKQVVDKAKRQTKKEEKPEVKATPMSGAAITQELDKLISDKDLNM